MASRRQFSNVLNNSHMRYVPKKQMKFDSKGGDGPMCLLFEAKPGAAKALNRRRHTWKASLASALPAGYYASMLLDASQMWMCYPGLILPTLFFLRQAGRVNRALETRVDKMWVLQNGDQLVCRTSDGLLHKLNIVQNTHHNILTKKNNEIVFEVTNNKRSF